MYHVKLRKTGKEKRKLRVRKKIFGTAEKPRLSIFRSNKNIRAQLIDDESGVTLVSANTTSLKGKSKTEIASKVGEELAKKALEKKIKHVVFDRSGYRYHGRVKALADGARKGGLKL
ncbi:50S ribosomal protein L18 [Patescibacteria group bacterium]